MDCSLELAMCMVVAQAQLAVGLEHAATRRAPAMPVHPASVRRRRPGRLARAQARRAAARAGTR
jgi:hypothetical protein